VNGLRPLRIILKQTVLPSPFAYSYCSEDDDDDDDDDTGGCSGI